MTEPDRTRGVILAVVASAVWGTVPVAGKVALQGITAPLLSSIRLLLAGLFLAAVIRRRGGRPFVRPPGLVSLAALGLAGNYVCYMLGVEHAGPAVGQVIIQTAPVFLVLLSVVFLRERPTARQLAGTVVALSGVLLVSLKGVPTLGPDHVRGVLFLLAGAFTWGVYGTAHRRLGARHGSGPTMMWIFLLSGLLTLPLLPFVPLRRPAPVHLAAIAFLCVNTVVAYWSFAEALRHIEASLAAVIVTLGPVVTFSLLAVANRLEQDVLPHEPLTPARLAGAALVVGGVCAAVTGRRRG